MYCTRCGTKAKEGDYYCRVCGAVVDHEGLEDVTTFPPIPRADRKSVSAPILIEGEDDINWTAILGFILGIISVFMCWTVVIGFFSGVLGLIFSMLGRKSQKKGLSKAGIILNIAGGAVSILIGLYYVYLFQMMLSTSAPYIVEFERQFSRFF